MTLKNSIVAKFSVAFVAMAMAFVLVAPVAQADDLESMSMEDLIALVMQLQAQSGLGDDSGDSMDSGSGSCYTWTRDLTMGSSGDDVMELQKFLMGAGQSIPAGPTDYFGGQTQAALAAWQGANGVSPAVGYFGPLTRAAVHGSCVPAMDDHSDDDSDDSSDDSDDSDDSSDDSLSGGEADVDSYEFSDEEDEAEEGEEDVAVHNVEFDVEDGDVRLERMDINFDRSGLNSGCTTSCDAEDEPWDVFDEISIWVDGDKVASEDSTDEDDWDEDGDDFEFRLTNIDSVFREDTSGEVVIAVSIANGVDVDGDAGDDDWMINIPADGMRFVDGEGLDIEGDTGAGTASTFEITESGDNDDLDLDSSSDDPDSATLEISEDNEVEHLIFAFDLSAEDSEDDVVLDNLVSVSVNVSGTDGTSLNNFIDDFRLEIDGESFDAESYTGTGQQATVDFDIDGDVSVPEDGEVTALLYANFDDVGSSFSDATVSASTTPAQIDAEGDNSGENITVGGSARNGEVHTVRVAGLEIGEVTDGDGSGDATHNDQDTADDSYGEFFLTFDVTAFGEDAFVPMASTTRSGTADSEAGVTYTIEDSNTGSATSSGSVSVTYEIDGADEEGNFYELEEGETYEMTVTVNSYNPAAAGTYNFQLVSIGFTDQDDDGTRSEAATPLNDYESDDVYVES